MEQTSAQIEAEKLLKSIIENQPNLLQLGNHPGQGQVTGKDAAEYITQLYQGLTAMYQNPND